MLSMKSEKIFRVRGPLGFGIPYRDSGLYIAFAAGTGVLPFLDLVA